MKVEASKKKDNPIFMLFSIFLYEIKIDDIVKCSLIIYLISYFIIFIIMDDISMKFGVYDAIISIKFTHNDDFLPLLIAAFTYMFLIYPLIVIVKLIKNIKKTTQPAIELEKLKRELEIEKEKLLLYEELTNVKNDIHIKKQIQKMTEGV